MRRATECFSMNSLMSTRIRWSSLSNRKPASALHSSVLPTPVGPRKRKEPVGRFAVLQFGDLVEVALAGEFLDLEADAAYLLHDVLGTERLGFFGLPDFVEV